MNRVRERGFTLIEMMIAIATVAVLAAVAIPNFLSYRASSHVSVCKANINMVIRACETHYINTGMILTDISALCRKSVGGPYLRSVPTCPVGGTYSATFDAGEQQFHVSCSAFDAEKHNVAEPDNQ